MKKFALKTAAILMSFALGAEILPPQAPFAYAEEISDTGESETGEPDTGELFSDEIVEESPEETGDDLIAEDSEDDLTDGIWEAGGEDPDSTSELTVPDGILQDDETENPDVQDALFEEETETGPETEDPEPEIVMETAEISDTLYTPDTIVPVEDARYGSVSAGRPRRAERRQLSAAAEGNGFSFASQLSGEARSMYDSKTAYYAVGHHTDTWTYKPDSSSYRFEGKLVGRKFDENDQETLNNVAACKNEMMRDMQGAADAFKHDHPEVFWIRSPKKYGWGYLYDKSTVKEEADGTHTATFYIAQITYTPVETFTGAGSRIDEYNSGVAAAAAQVRSMADALNTEGAAADSPQYQALLVRAADQYLSGRLYYDNAGLHAAAEASRAEASAGEVTANDVNRIYTSAAAFLDEGGSLTMGVVCEGYAKALKVLCDNLGIPCVCIAGLSDKNSSGSGHMWNGVEIGGIWYLTDPTWDDTGDVNHRESSRKYLLVSNYTNNRDLANRQATGNLNGSTLDGITVFQYPAISETCYETSHNYITQAAGQDGNQETYDIDKCQVCGYSVAGHDYKLFSSVEATCTEQGYELSVCRHCGKLKYEITQEPLGHDYRVTVVAPTCEEDGYTVHTCSRGDSSYKTDIKEKLGHTYDDGVVTAPTCTARGYTTYNCVRGDFSYKTDYTDKLPHDDQKTSRTEPTCTEEGSIVYTCRNCGRQRTETIPAPGHDYQAEHVTAPTCTAQGYTTYTCVRCGTSYRADLRAKLGHSYQKKVTDPTCTTQGFTTYTCIRDGASYAADYKKALGHSYNVKVIAPTEKRKGYTLHTCRRCGRSYKDRYKAKLLKKTKLKKVRAGCGGKFTVTFARTQKYNKYEIQYATKRDFSNAVKKIVTRKRKTNQVTIRGKKKKVYYVRVRVISGSRVGAWSNVRKVRTKRK